MKRNGKLIGLKVLFLLAFACLFIAVKPAEAKAANYRVMDIYAGRQDRPKAGSYYFWTQYSGDRKNVYASKSASAKSGTLIASHQQAGSSSFICTNGSLVYYLDNQGSKSTFYSVSVQGTNRKK